MNVKYEIGTPEKDGTLLLYGFTLPNLYAMDEQEDTDVMFRWAERIAAIKAPATGSECVGLTLATSSLLPQGITMSLISPSGKKELGHVVIKGEKAWENIHLSFEEPITFEPGDIIELLADNEYLGLWRQNCYRLSTTTFHYRDNISSDFGYEEYRRPPEKEKYQLLFGDPHVHTNASLCFPEIEFGSLQKNIDKALEKDLDFISFTDHPEHFLHFDIWDKFEAIFKKYEKPPFIILPGYEWASKSYGNYNIYFDAIPKFESVVHPWEQRGNSLQKLWTACRLSGCRFLTVPHHTYHPFLPIYTSYPVPAEMQSAVEVFSTWGSSEAYDPEPWHRVLLQENFTLNPGFYVEDMLRRGMKLGFLGGTDAHANWAGNAGMTGLYVEDFSVKGIFDAIVTRRAYATTGIKLKLAVTVNGFPMGHIFNVNQYSVNVVFPLQFVIDIEGTSAITKVELIANGSVIRSETYTDGTNEKHLEWEVGRGTFELADTNRYYYVRVYQTEGGKTYSQQGMAWSSPVWVDYEFAENPVGDGQNRKFTDVNEHLMVPFTEKTGMRGKPRKFLLDI